MKDFHGFKKIATDQKSTTFAHPNGSKLVVAHGRLDKKTLDSLAKMPIHAPKKAPVQKYSGEDGDPQSSVVEVPDYATTPVEDIALPQDQAPEDPQTQRLRDTQDTMNNIGSFAHSAKRALFDDWTKPDEHPYEPVDFKKGAPSVSPSEVAPPVNAGAPTNVNLNNRYQPAQQGVMAGMPQANDPNFKYDPFQGINTQMGGVREEANAIGKMEDAKVAAIHQHQEAMNAINYQAQQNAFNNKVETENWTEDMKNSHIDPQAYVNNMSGGQKAATAIGMILGGMGQGLMHTGSNAVVDMLNKNIDRDVQAQVLNRDNKKTVFNAMQKQYGNEQDALQMTRAFYLQKLQNDLGEAAAKSGSQLAQARASQAIGPLQQQLQQIHFDVGMRQAALKGINSGNDTMAAAAIPYLVRDKTKVEDAAKAYGAAKSLNEQQTNALKSFDQIHNMIGHGMFSPNDAASAKQAFVGTLQVALEHRYNPEAAAALGNALWPSKTDVSEKTVQNKRERLIKEFNGARDEHDSVLRALTGGLMGAPAPTPQFTKRK